MNSIRRASPLLQKFSSRYFGAVASTRVRHVELIPHEAFGECLRERSAGILEHRNYIINSQPWQQEMVPLAQQDKRIGDWVAIFESTNNAQACAKAFNTLDHIRASKHIFWNRVAGRLYWSAKDCNPECSEDGGVMAKYKNFKCELTADPKSLYSHNLSAQEIAATQRIEEA